MCPPGILTADNRQPMPIDTSLETWQRVQEEHCPDAACAGAIALEFDPAHDEREGIAVLRCDTCGRRWGVYLSATGHGVEQLPD
jgi:hypothetical protein